MLRTHPISARSWRVGLAAVAATGLAIRLLYVLLLVGDDPVAGDAIYYSAQADAIADGRGFEHPFTGEPAADHPPATAVILAPASLGDGDPLFRQRITMALLGTVAVLAIARLGREVAGEAAGLAAGGLAALHPGLWVNDGLAMSETPTTLITALVLLVALRWRRGDAPAWQLGVLGGLAVLTRAELGLLMALVVIPVGLTGPWPARLRRVGAVALVALLVVAPWTVRNVLRFEEPVLVSTNDGLTLRGANCDPSYFVGVGFWHLSCAEPVDGDQSEVSAEYRRQAVGYIGDHLDRVPTVLAARLARVWSVWEVDEMTYLNRGEGRPRTVSWLAAIAWWGLVPLAAAGAWSARRQQALLLVLGAPFVTVTITALATYGIPRFRLPAEVAAIAAASIVAAAAHRRWADRRTVGDPVPEAS